jgi:hypothetical protein
VLLWIQRSEPHTSFSLVIHFILVFIINKCKIRSVWNNLSYFQGLFSNKILRSCSKCYVNVYIHHIHIIHLHWYTQYGLSTVKMMCLQKWTLVENYYWRKSSTRIVLDRYSFKFIWNIMRVRFHAHRGMLFYNCHLKVSSEHLLTKF